MADAHNQQTTCLYCGKAYRVGAESCPHCQAPAHQRPGERLRRFRRFVIVLALICLVLILWLPR